MGTSLRGKQVVCKECVSAGECGAPREKNGRGCRRTSQQPQEHSRKNDSASRLRRTGVSGNPRSNLVFDSLNRRVIERLDVVTCLLTERHQSAEVVRIEAARVAELPGVVPVRSLER